MTTEDGNWVGVHCVDAPHIAADRTDDPALTEAADARTETMMNEFSREIMFYGMNAHYAGFLAWSRTGWEANRKRGIDAADAMVEYFDERTRPVPHGIPDIEGPEAFRSPESDHGQSGNRLGTVDAAYVALAPVWRPYHEAGEPRTVTGPFRTVTATSIGMSGTTVAPGTPRSSNPIRAGWSAYTALAHSDAACWPAA